MQKIIAILCFSAVVSIFPSCKKNNNPAESKPAGIHLTITRQRTVPEIKLYKYDGLTVVDSATVTPGPDRVFSSTIHGLTKTTANYK